MDSSINVSYAKHTPILSYNASFAPKVPLSRSQARARKPIEERRVPFSILTIQTQIHANGIFLRDATPTSQYKLQITENTKRARRNFQDSPARGLLKIIIFRFNLERIFLFFFYYFHFSFTPPPRKVSKFLLLVCVCVLTAGWTPHRSERVPPAHLGPAAPLLPAPKGLSCPGGFRRHL